MSGKFEFISYDTIQQVISHIQRCEGQHRQQVCYSTYHNALTQICFDCKLIRSNIDWDKDELPQTICPLGETSSDGN